MTETPGNTTKLATHIRRLQAACARPVVLGPHGLVEGILNAQVYEAAKGLFLACQGPGESKPGPLLGELRRLAPQYGKPEYLLPVDGSGAPLAATEGVLRDFRLIVAAHPEFALWMQEASPPGSGKTGGVSLRVTGTIPLLVARWLCALSGLRHRTVELFIDHPQASGYTLIQVRSLAKLDYPGCFDLPCAGHVVGLASVEEGLVQELGEELGLREADLAGLRRLGTYEHAESRGAQRAMLDVEHRTVFRARLQPGALERIRFADGEVAAIAVFADDDLQDLMREAPERIASGLSASLALYLGG